MSFMTPNMSSQYQFSSQSSSIETQQLIYILGVIKKHLKESGFSQEVIGATEIAFLFNLKIRIEEMMEKNSTSSQEELNGKLFKIGVPFYETMLYLINQAEFIPGSRLLSNYLTRQIDSKKADSGQFYSIFLRALTKTAWVLQNYNRDLADYEPRIFDMSSFKDTIKILYDAEVESLTKNDVDNQIQWYRDNNHKFNDYHGVLYDNLNDQQRNKVLGEVYDKQKKVNREGAKTTFEEEIIPQLFVLSKIAGFTPQNNGMSTSQTLFNEFDTASKKLFSANGNVSEESYMKYLCKAILFPLSLSNNYYERLRADILQKAANNNRTPKYVDTLRSVIVPFTSAMVNFFTNVIPFDIDFYASISSENKTQQSFEALAKQFVRCRLFWKSLEASLQDVARKESKIGTFQSTGVGGEAKSLLRQKVENLRNFAEKIMNSMQSKDKDAVRAFKKSYLYDDADFLNEASYYGDLITLIKDFKGSADKFKKFDNAVSDEAYFLNDENKLSDFYKSKSVVYNKILYEYFNKSAEFFEEYYKYRIEVDKDKDNDTNTWKKKFEKLREVKLNYSSLVISLFKRMISLKYATESNFINMLKSLNVNVDMEKFNEIYNDYINSAIKTQRMNDITDLKEFCDPIGKNLNEWNYSKDSINIEGSGFKASLRRLNSMIYNIIKSMQENQKMPNFSNPYKDLINVIKDCIIKDLMTFTTLKTLTKPFNSVLNFDFFQECTIEKEKNRVKLDLDSFKEGKIVGEKLLNFIKAYMKVDIGYTTYGDRYFFKNSYFLNMKDSKLKPKLTSLQDMMEKYEKLMKNKTEQIVGDDSKNKEDEDTEASTDDESEDEKEEVKEDKAPVEKEIVEKLNSEGYVVPLMFHNNASMTTCDCEYQIMPNNQGVQIKLLNCPDVNTRPIIAVPIVNNSTMAPVTLNAGVGTITNLAVGSNTQIHFYYESIDANKFIGSSRLHGLKDLKDAKELSVNYVDKNLDNDKEKTAISDYGDKIIVQLPKSFYPKNVVFVTCNEANKPDPDKYKHNVVCTKDGRYLLIIEDADLLKSLGNKFELHMYTNNISGGTYVTKLMIDRDSASSSDGKDASKLDEKDVKSKDKKVFAEDLEDEAEDGEKNKSSKKSKKSKKKGKKKDRGKEVDLDKEDEDKDNEEKKDFKKKPNLTLLDLDDDLDSTDDDYSFSDYSYDLFD